MKTNKLNPLFLIFALLIGTFAVFADEGGAALKDSGLDYTELAETVSNPHMGFPRRETFRFTQTGNAARNSTGFTWYYVNLSNFTGGNELYNGTGAKPFGGADIPITADALNTFSQTLENLRQNGGSAFMRVVYDWDGINGCEPSNFEMILTHVRQLCEVVSDYPDLVLGFECGLIGPWGEMHSSKYTGAEYVNRVIDAYLDNTPDSMRLMVRQPKYIENYLGVSAGELASTVTEKGSKEYRLCYFNDGYMNTDNDYGTWTDRARDLIFLGSQSEHAPYGGEYGNDYARLPSNVCKPENAIPEMYQTHVSFIRSNIYNRNVPNIKGGKNTYFGYDDYTYGTQYEKSWFPDNSAFYGVDCYTFIESHLGYRLVLRDSKLSLSPQAGGVLKLQGKIENTGFANVIHNPAARVLIVKDGGIAYSCGVDLNAYDIKSCSVYDYGFGLQLPSAMPDGDYDVYLQLSSVEENFYTRAKSGIRFANKGGIYNPTLGANRLGTITVTAAEQAGSAAGDVFMQSPKSGGVYEQTLGAPLLLGAGFTQSSDPITLPFFTGDDINLTVLDFVSGQSSVDYKWYKNGAVISSDKDLTISGVSLSDAGEYKRVTTVSGSVSHTTVAANITVFEHTMSAWSTTAAPTCSMAGTAFRSCSDGGCGLSETKSLPPLDHIAGTAEIVPSDCTDKFRERIPCVLCGETLSVKVFPALGHNNVYSVSGNVVSNSCSVCGNTVWSKAYDNTVTDGETFSAAPVSAFGEPIVLIGENGFTPVYNTKAAAGTSGPDELTFVFEMRGVVNPVTLAKFRVITKTRGSTSNIDSNNSGNYRGSSAGLCEYSVTDDGYWAFTLNGQLVTWTAGGLENVTWAAFSDPKSHADIWGQPVNDNPDSTFRLVSIHDGAASYDIVYVDWKGDFLERQNGSYNTPATANKNRITKVHSADSLYEGQTPQKPADKDYIYTFDRWVDSDGNPIDHAAADIIAYPSFTAEPNSNPPDGLTIDIVEKDGLDVIELRNYTGSAVSVRGLFLTDDGGDLFKWQMPCIIIRRDGQARFFESGGDGVLPVFTDTPVLKRSAVNFDISAAEGIYVAGADRGVLADVSRF